jgi:hypothetical protein
MNKSAMQKFKLWLLMLVCLFITLPLVAQSSLPTQYEVQRYFDSLNGSNSPFMAITQFKIETDQISFIYVISFNSYHLNTIRDNPALQESLSAYYRDMLDDQLNDWLTSSLMRDFISEVEGDLNLDINLRYQFLDNDGLDIPSQVLSVLGN